MYLAHFIELDSHFIQLTSLLSQQLVTPYTQTLCGAQSLRCRKGLCFRFCRLGVSDVHVQSNNLLTLVNYVLRGGYDVNRKFLFLSLLDQILL